MQRRIFTLLKAIGFVCLVPHLAMGTSITSPKGNDSGEAYQFRFNLKKGSTYKYNVHLNLSTRSGGNVIPMITLNLPTQMVVEKVEQGLAHVKLQANVSKQSVTQREILISPQGKITRKDGSKASIPIPKLWPKRSVKVGEKWSVKGSRLGRLAQLMGYNQVLLHCTFNGFEHAKNRKLAKVGIVLYDSVKKAQVGEGELQMDAADGMIHCLDVKCKEAHSNGKNSFKEAVLKVTRLS
jgi:hypothetical protein